MTCARYRYFSSTCPSWIRYASAIESKDLPPRGSGTLPPAPANPATSCTPARLRYEAVTVSVAPVYSFHNALISSWAGTITPWIKDSSSSMFDCAAPTQSSRDFNAAPGPDEKKARAPGEFQFEVTPSVLRWTV
jgi:hypothetical protein